MPACHQPIEFFGVKRTPVLEGTGGNPAIYRVLLQKVPKVSQNGEEHGILKTMDGWLAAAFWEKQEKKPKCLLGLLCQKYQIVDNAVFFAAKQIRTGCCYPVQYNNLHMGCKAVRRIWEAVLQLKFRKRVLAVPGPTATAGFPGGRDRCNKNHLS